MRPVEHTTEAIIKAGKDLQEAGRKVTGFALRREVRGGSATRLRQVWDEYLASQSETVADPVSDLPVEISEKMAAVTSELTGQLNALAIDLNDKAIKAAERRTRDLVRAAGEQRIQAESEMKDAGQTVDDLEQKLDEKQTETDELQIELARARAVDQAQAVELAQVRERLTQTEQAAKFATTQYAVEVARMTAGIESDRIRHQQENEKLGAELAEQKKAAQAITSDLTTANAKVAAASETHQEQRSEIEQLRATWSAEGKARAAAENQVAVLTSRIGDIHTRAEKFEKLAVETGSKLASAYVTIQSNRDRLDSAAAELAEAKTVAEAARITATKAIEEAAELRGKCAAMIQAAATTTVRRHKTKAPTAKSP